MAPMKSLLAPKQSAAASRGGGDGGGTVSSRQSAAVTGTTTPVYGAPAAATAAGLGAGTLAAVSISALAAGPAEHRGRGRGAYAAFLQYDGVGGGSGACTGTVLLVPYRGSLRVRSGAQGNRAHVTRYGVSSTALDIRQSAIFEL